MPTKNTSPLFEYPVLFVNSVKTHVAELCVGAITGTAMIIISVPRRTQPTKHKKLSFSNKMYICYVFTHKFVQIGTIFKTQ